MSSERANGTVVPDPPPTFEASITAPLRVPAVAKARLGELVESYMLNSKASKLDGSIHPALDTTSDKVLLGHQFIPITSKTVKLNNIYRDVEAEKDEFIKAVNDYNAKAKSQYNIEVKPGEEHSLTSLMDSVESAAKEFKEKSEEGLWGKIRKAFRQFGEEEAAVRAWLKLLPSDSEYLSVICGGLKLILGAAKRSHAIRDEIAEALCEIPSALYNAQRAHRAFDWSDDLHKRSAALLAAIIRAIGHIVAYFKESTWRKLPRAAFLQSNYQRDLSQRISAIQKCCEDFTKEANTCGIEVARNTNDGVAAANLKIDLLGKNVQVLKQMLEHLKSQPEGPEYFYRGSRSYSNLQSLELSRPSSPEVNSKWKKQCFAEDITHRRQLSPLSLEGPPPNWSMKPRNSTSDLQKSLSRLSFETHFDSPMRDLKRNVALAFKLDEDDQDRAVHLMQSTRLQSWLTSIKCSVLLINGNAPVPAGNRRGPLSFVAAKIIDSLQQASSKSASEIIVLHYFCGEHVDQSEDPDASPAGLMNSLLAQLLTRYEDFDLSTVHNLKKVDTESTKALCKTFAKLVSQLPEEMLVFCVIDGLSHYDDKERRADMEELLERLTALTRKNKQGEGCKFKLLLTVRSRLYADYLDNQETFTLPSEVERGDGFTAMKWNLEAGRSIRDLSSKIGSN